MLILFSLFYRLIKVESGDIASKGKLTNKRNSSQQQQQLLDKQQQQQQKQQQQQQHQQQQQQLQQQPQQQHQQQEKERSVRTFEEILEKSKSLNFCITNEESL